MLIILTSSLLRSLAARLTKWQIDGNRKLYHSILRYSSQVTKSNVPNNYWISLPGQLYRLSRWSANVLAGKFKALPSKSKSSSKQIMVVNKIKKTLLDYLHRYAHGFPVYSTYRSWWQVKYCYFFTAIQQTTSWVRTILLFMQLWRWRGW